MLKYLVWAIATAIKPVEMLLSCVVMPRGMSAGPFGADFLRTISLPWHFWHSQAHGMGLSDCEILEWSNSHSFGWGLQASVRLSFLLWNKRSDCLPQKLPRKIRIYMLCHSLARRKHHTGQPPSVWWSAGGVLIFHQKCRHQEVFSSESPSHLFTNILRALIHSHQQQIMFFANPESNSFPELQ